MKGNSEAKKITRAFIRHVDAQMGTALAQFADTAYREGRSKGYLNSVIELRTWLGFLERRGRKSVSLNEIEERLEKLSRLAGGGH